MKSSWIAQSSVRAFLNNVKPSKILALFFLAFSWATSSSRTEAQSSSARSTMPAFSYIAERLLRRITSCFSRPLICLEASMALPKASAASRYFPSLKSFLPSLSLSSKILVSLPFSFLFSPPSDFFFSFSCLSSSSTFPFTLVVLGVSSFPSAATVPSSFAGAAEGSMGGKSLISSSPPFLFITTKIPTTPASTTHAATIFCVRGSIGIL
mmetsp:Transcript_9697/g.19737  ORF Transcript_9697/g.19737 Transcript_9697/m.19737 type:complete len:210 (-) Transcript_9697:15-644(-)